MSDLMHIHVEGAPKAIGPYSQGLIANGFLFTAGQVPFDPATMKIVEGDIRVQAERVFDNLQAILEGAGCTFSDVVKATVFLMDLGDFAAMNEVYARRMGDHRPARSTVQVSKLPAGAQLEIDLIAVVRR
jgi:2-iminobutanoate/2-iminopropanoate deaminase